MLGFSSFNELAKRDLEKEGFESADKRKQFLEKVNAAGEVKSIEAEWICKNGSHIIVQESAKVIRDSKGKILYYDGIVEDVTERRKIYEALRQSEDRFRTLFENMTEGVALHEVIYDQLGIAADYKILSINPAYIKHTGVMEEYVVGLLASEAYGVDSPPYLKEYAKVAESGVSFWFETYFPPLEKHFHISVFSPRHGQFATVFEDITSAKKKEEELMQRNDEMARFTYTVSHDLKSPLVTIKTFLGYLEEDIRKNDEESRKKDIDYIQNAAQKMSNLLDELLNLSRIGRRASPFVDIPFREIVEEALNLVAGQLNKRGVNVEVAQSPVLVYCERQRMIEVFQNLLDNGVKFMGNQNNPQIDVAVNKVDGEYVFSVKDNGIGIDPKYHKRIFNLFEKLDVQTNGTGIGLAAVHRIIETHSGKIWVESEGVGKGTTFKFTIGKTKLDNKQ
jgi:PAS domain S-box-containing protein